MLQLSTSFRAIQVKYLMRGGGRSPKMSKNNLNTIINYNLDTMITKKSSTPPLRYLTGIAFTKNPCHGFLPWCNLAYEGSRVSTIRQRRLCSLGGHCQVGIASMMPTLPSEHYPPNLGGTHFTFSSRCRPSRPSRGSNSQLFGLRGVG